MKTPRAERTAKTHLEPRERAGQGKPNKKVNVGAAIRLTSPRRPLVQKTHPSAGSRHPLQSPTETGCSGGVADAPSGAFVVAGWGVCLFCWFTGCWRRGVGGSCWRLQGGCCYWAICGCGSSRSGEVGADEKGRGHFQMDSTSIFTSFGKQQHLLR